MSERTSTLGNPDPAGIMSVHTSVGPRQLVSLDNETLGGAWIVKPVGRSINPILTWVRGLCHVSWFLVAGKYIYSMK